MTDEEALRQLYVVADEALHVGKGRQATKVLAETLLHFDARGWERPRVSAYTIRSLRGAHTNFYRPRVDGPEVNI